MEVATWSVQSCSSVSLILSFENGPEVVSGPRLEAARTSGSRVA